VNDYKVYSRSEINQFDHVFAWDSMDGEIIDKVVVIETTVRIKNFGTHTVTYSVTDPQGKTTTKTVNIEVADP